MAKKRSGSDMAARFAKLSESVETEAEKALFAIATDVRDAAVRLAPTKSGKLKSSYAVRMRYRGTVPVAVIGTLVEYATFVEFAKTVKGKPYGKKLAEPARVVYRALDENYAEIEQKIADAIGRGLGAVEGGV